jgi:integrase
MATFDKRGDLQWRAQIRRKGYPVVRKTFDSRADAEAWARSVENEMDRGVFVSRTEAENTTLAEALDRYEREVSSLKKSASIERFYLQQWRKHPLGNRFIATIRSSDIAAWRDTRLTQVGPTSVRHEMEILSHLFNIASREWGMVLPNPVSNVRRPKPAPGRDRRVTNDEIERICKNTDSASLPLILRFAVETGMRRGEIARMRWEHIDLKKRTLKIPVTKTDQPRTIPLSRKACQILGQIQTRPIDGRIWELSDPLYISKAFDRAIKRAGIEDLHFHDLRHEATSRFFEKGLNPMQVAAITGHKTLQMLKRYTHLKAEDLAELLK